MTALWLPAGEDERLGQLPVSAGVSGIDPERASLSSVHRRTSFTTLRDGL